MSKTAKIYRIPWAKGHIAIYCPGCELNHTLNIDPANGSPCHTLTGTDDCPTIRASILEPGDRGLGPRCHSFVTEGRIEFLSDSTHKLAGQTVPLPAFVDCCGITD